MPIITFNRRGLGRLLALASGRHHGLFRNLVMRQRFGSSIILIIESLTFLTQFAPLAQCVGLTANFLFFLLLSDTANFAKLSQNFCEIS